MSESHIGMDTWIKGKHHSEETKRKIRLKNIGRKHKEETKKNISNSLMGKRVGEKNPVWKGNNVSYKGLHQWIRKYKPRKERCEKCGEKKKLDVANISGEYKRDVNDYQWLCRSCHFKIHAHEKQSC